MPLGLYGAFLQVSPFPIPNLVTVIRYAREEDVPEILAMIRELADYEQSLAQVGATETSLRGSLFCDHPAVFCHVAEGTERTSPKTSEEAALGASERASATMDSGELAGFALWFLNFSTWEGRHGIYLEDLYVRPRWRRYGYGRAILIELGRIAAERGYGRLEWWVLDWNVDARAFYRSIGAVPMDEWTVWRVTGDALRSLASGQSVSAAG